MTAKVNLKSLSVPNLNTVASLKNPENMKRNFSEATIQKIGVKVPKEKLKEVTKIYLEDKGLSL